MLYWLETMGVLGAAFLGVLIGLWFSHLKKPYWLIGYLAPLVMLLMVTLAAGVISLYFLVPFRWITKGRTEYVLMSLSVPMIFSVLLPRIERRLLKYFLILLTAIALIYYAIFPFLVPFFVRDRLATLVTVVNDGVCLQSTGYSCGPAAAVTALNRLGIEADEGRIAIEAYTTPVLGTADDLLSRAIERCFADYGIKCQARRFESIAELKDNCPTIAIIKYSFLVDHYVTVLDVLDNYVIIGDPITGRQNLTYDEFGKKWRFIGIVVKRQGD